MNWLQHDINERKVMLQEVADSIHLPVLYVDYESISDNSSPYMPSRVKIEISSLSMREPFEMREISSMIRGGVF